MCSLWIFSNLLNIIDKLLLDEDIYKYHFVSQGKIEIPNVDDGEECKLTDVSRRNNILSNTCKCYRAHSEPAKSIHNIASTSAPISARELGAAASDEIAPQIRWRTNVPGLLNPAPCPRMANMIQPWWRTPIVIENHY